MPSISDRVDKISKLMRELTFCIIVPFSDPVRWATSCFLWLIVIFHLANPALLLADKLSGGHVIEICGRKG
jgi:hypothetical protein